MSKIYCGNNALDPELVSGESALGTRYGCLRKGIGTGLALPVDPRYSGPYEPIDKSRIYCGKAAKKPKGYTRLGSLVHCLQKGVGMGRKMKADSAFSAVNDSDYAPYLFETVVGLVLFFFIWRWRPSFILCKDTETGDRILWGRFLLLYVFAYLLLYVLLYGIMASLNELSE